MGGFILGGSSASPISGNKEATNFGVNDFWIVRVDSNGVKLWDKSFGGAAQGILGGRDGILSLQQTRDGGFILGGASNSRPSGNKISTNYGDYDFWVVRVDSNGVKLWD